LFNNINTKVVHIQTKQMSGVDHDFVLLSLDFIFVVVNLCYLEAFWNEIMFIRYDMMCI